MGFTRVPQNLEMAGYSMYNQVPSWYNTSDDVVMNDGNNFSFLEEQPTNVHSRSLGGHPMEVSSSNNSASSAYSTNTAASTVTTASSMSSYTNQRSPIDDQHNGFPKAFGNMSIGDSDYNNTYGSLSSHAYREPDRYTPSSLRWTDQTRVAEFYDLVLEKSPKEPYLILKTHARDPPLPDIYYMPYVVYLDHDEREQTDKNYHPCLYPGKGCWKNNHRHVFKRAADLERHYNVVHHASVVEIKCDYRRCGRHTDAFTRKDHCRDHYKEYHKEDIGAFKGAKNSTDKAKSRAKQQEWESGRNIEADWWRCPRCLDRIQIAIDGWSCKSCKRDCEAHRIEARMKLANGLQECYAEGSSTKLAGSAQGLLELGDGLRGSFDEYESAGHSPTETQTYLPDCNICPDCQDLGYTYNSEGVPESCYCRSLGGATSSSHYNNGSGSQQQYSNISYSRY